MLAACGSSSSSSTGASNRDDLRRTANVGHNAGDLAIVEAAALTLEYLETTFYEKVIASGFFTGKVASMIEEFGRPEQTHVEALKGTAEKLGGTPAPNPNGEFPIESANQVAQLAYTVENLGAAAFPRRRRRTSRGKEVLPPPLWRSTRSRSRHAATIGTLIKKSSDTRTVRSPSRLTCQWCWRRSSRSCP